MIKKVINLGDTALYCDFGDVVNKEINSKVINLFKYLTDVIKKKETLILYKYAMQLKNIF